MPIHLTHSSRREFLAALGGSLLTLPALAVSTRSVDEDLVAILNDTHIGEKQPPASPIPQNLEATVKCLLALEKRPVAVLINGDLALRDGQPGDYKFFIKLVQPLRDGGIPVHLTLGNHDSREIFYEVLSSEKQTSPAVLSRHAALLVTRHANFLLLDSLKQTMIAQGDLGQAQLDWIARELDAHPGKPAIIVAHHNPRLGGDPLHFPGGLIDSEPLWEVLAARKQAKAYIHGHIHHWGLATHAGIHIANTPAVSYVANRETSTTGWTMARLRPDGMTLTTLTHLSDHPWNNKTHELKWRV